MGAERKILIEIKAAWDLSKLKGLFADRGTNENGIKMSRVEEHERFLTFHPVSLRRLYC